jgi:hypothetical protein
MWWELALALGLPPTHAREVITSAEVADWLLFRSNCNTKDQLLMMQVVQYLDILVAIQTGKPGVPVKALGEYAIRYEDPTPRARLSAAERTRLAKERTSLLTRGGGTKVRGHKKGKQPPPTGTQHG